MKKLILKYKKEILYLVFGGFTTLVNIIFYYLFFNLLCISNALSTALAWFVSVLFAYITNRVWVFESKASSAKAVFFEVTAFFACRVITGITDIAIMVFAVDIMLWNSLLWKITSNVFVIILNYIASKLIIFKKSSDER